MRKNEPQLFLLTSEKIVYVLLTLRANDLTHAEKMELIIEIEEALKNKFADKFSITLVWSSGYGKSDLKVWSENAIERIIPYGEISQFFIGSKLETYLMPEKLARRVNLGDFIVFPDKQYVEYSLRLTKNTHRHQTNDPKHLE